MAVRQMSKLNLQSIYKDFSNVVRDRKKDFAGPFHKKYGNSFNPFKQEIFSALTDTLTGTGIGGGNLGIGMGAGILAGIGS